MHKTTLPGAVLALAVGLLACGCGGSSTSGSSGDKPSASAGAAMGAAPTAARVAAATGHATSVRVSGSVRSKGAATTLAMDLTKAGQMSGTLTVGSAPVQVLLTGGQAYLKMDSKFLASQHIPTSACAMVCGHWVKAPASDVGELNQEAWANLVRPMAASIAKIDMAAARAVTFHGQPAWKVTGAQGAIAYIARGGQPYLLGLKQGLDNLVFSEWGHATIPAPPAARSVVSLP